MRQKNEDTKSEFKQHGRRLQNENQDLRFLNTQYLTKVKFDLLIFVPFKFDN